MNHRDFINLFKICADTSIGYSGNFVRGRRPDASLVSIAKENLPLIVMLPFRETKDYTKRTIVRQVTMFFLKQDSLQNQGTPEFEDSVLDKRDAIVAEMSSLQDLFVQNLQGQLDDVSSFYYGKGSIGQILATPEYGILAGYFTGYGISFTFNSKMEC